VLCFIRPDFEPRLVNCPIVRCTKEDLAERLAELLEDEPRRRALGERGRAYVEREHAAPVLARRLIDRYASLGAGDRPVEPIAATEPGPHA